MKKNPLAPIEAKILLCPPRRTQKIWKEQRETAPNKKNETFSKRKNLVL